jgi:hypothetical protein
VSRDKTNLLDSLRMAYNTIVRILEDLKGMRLRATGDMLTVLAGFWRGRSVEPLP